MTSFEILIYAFSDVNGSEIGLESTCQFCTKNAIGTDCCENFSHCEFTSTTVEWKTDVLVLAVKHLLKSILLLALFCGCEQRDPPKKTCLSGKVSDLRARICDILDIPLSSIDPESFVCNERCYCEVKRYEKIHEEIKTLHLSLNEKFACRARPKRGLPSDVSISPGVVAHQNLFVTRPLKQGQRLPRA